LAGFGITIESRDNGGNRIAGDSAFLRATGLSQPAGSRLDRCGLVEKIRHGG
jgi:hypothetical protein